MKRLWFTVAGIGLALAVLSGTILHWRLPNDGAQAQTPPSPPATPVVNGSPAPAPPLPHSTLPTYYRPSAAFANTVLHTTSTFYTFAPGSTDPANGQVLTIDTWVRIGPDGNPTIAHSLTSFPNGTLAQESRFTPNSQTLRRGKAVIPAGLGGAPACNYQLSANADVIQSIGPQFLDESLLPRSGFSNQGRQSRSEPPPLTPRLQGVTPAQTYAADSTVTEWSSTTRDGAGSTTTSFGIGASGRLAVHQVQRLDQQGQVQYSLKESFGSLDVYNPASVPASVFDLASGGCNA